jgi:hypothetical protein
MAVDLLTPFSAVLRRSAQVASGSSALTGRWVKVNASNQVVAPGTTRQGCYLCLEGTLLHTGSNTEFGASTPFASTKSAVLPSNAAAGACALAYGVFRYAVGPEGCDPTATFAVNGLATIDNDGRLTPQAAGADAEDNSVAVVEGITLDGASKVTLLTVRTLGK